MGGLVGSLDITVARNTLTSSSGAVGARRDKADRLLRLAELGYLDHEAEFERALELGGCWQSCCSGTLGLHACRTREESKEIAGPVTYDRCIGRCRGKADDDAIALAQSRSVLDSSPQIERLVATQHNRHVVPRIVIACPGTHRCKI